VDVDIRSGERKKATPSVWSEFSSALLCCGLRIVSALLLLFFFIPIPIPSSPFSSGLWACEAFQSTAADVAFIFVFPED
jgi:hypothetical protein